MVSIKKSAPGTPARKARAKGTAAGSNNAKNQTKTLDAKTKAQVVDPGLAKEKAGQTSRLAQIKVDGPKFEELEPAGQGPTGSNPGGWFKHGKTGHRYYVKTSRLNDAESEDRIHNEILASILYRLAGVEVAELSAVRITGSLGYHNFEDRLGLASKIIEGLNKDGELLKSNPKALPGLFDGFAVDAWTANWDVVGLSYDNLLVGGDGADKRGVRIEVGGALLYRGMGEAKGTRFGDSVKEIETMRDTKTAPQAGHVFSKMTNEEVEASVVRVLRIPDADIRKAVLTHGPGDLEKRQALADRLIARKEDLATRFPKAAKLAEKNQLSLYDAFAGKRTALEQKKGED